VYFHYSRNLLAIFGLEKHMRLMMALALALAAGAQVPLAPVIHPRGVTNAFSRLPAPALVARGSVLEIEGLNLGPPEGVAAPAGEAPLKLGDVEVLLNGMAVPVASAEPGKVIAQVPGNAPLGLAEVTVRNGTGESRAARVNIVALEPALRDARVVGGAIQLEATGFPANATLDAYVGGIRANAAAAPLAPGRFTVTVSGAGRPGDLVTLVANGRASANRARATALAAPEVQFVRVPEGAPEFRALASPDLNGSYVIATGARDANGCYAAYTFDLNARAAARAHDCLTTGIRNAASPVMPSPDSDSAAAFAGPPQGDLPAGVSNQVKIFRPGGEPVSVSLPAAAGALAGIAGGDYAALVPGASALVINSMTGEVREGGAAAGGGVAPGGGAGGVGALVQLRVDVDGLTTVVALSNLGQGRIAVVAADSAETPTRAKFAVLAGGDVQLTKEFPEGWLPFLGSLPEAAQRPGAPAGALLALRGSMVFDAVRRLTFVLSANRDRHGFAVFPLGDAAAGAIPFPNGWYAAGCAAMPRVFSFELTRSVAVAASTVLETEFATPCFANGFVLLDLGASTVEAVGTPNLEQFHLGNAGELNDYVYAANFLPPRNMGDALYVLDGVNRIVTKLALPTGIEAFQALDAVGELSLLVGAGRNTAAGDAGLVVFDLDNLEVRLLPVPADFAAVAELGVFPVSRKAAARAFRTRDGASSLVIYDLATGEPTVVPNPEGVVSFGPPPAQAQGPIFSPGTPPGPGVPPGPGLPPGQALPLGPQAAQPRLVISNPKANTVTAVGYGAGGRQVGVITVRVP
jgi:uncharacterized protein (TIGR03437 family)